MTSMPNLNNETAIVLKQEHEQTLASSSTSDQELQADGWERRFVVDQDRARETADLYSQLGFEVRIEAVKPSELESKCQDCQAVAYFRFKTVYTRPKQNQPKPSNKSS